MRFKQLFLELFDQTLPNYEEGQASRSVTFDLKGKTARFDLKANRGTPSKLADIFSRELLGDRKMISFVNKYFIENQKSTIDFGFTVNDGYIKSDQLKEEPGLVSQIFGTTIAMMKSVVQKRNPNVFMFEATKEEPSRVKLYNAIFLRFKAPGYEKLKYTYSDHYVAYVYYKKSIVADIQSTIDAELANRKPVVTK